MPTTYKISDHHVIQFARNVELLLQQKQPRFSGTFNAMTAQGDKAQVVLQFGEVEMENFNSGTGVGQWLGDTKWSDIEHHQRWVFPSDFSLALAISKPDPDRMLVDPRSSYVEAMRAAYARKCDDLIINAATGDSRVGKYDDLQMVPFPADQIIADNNEGLTVAKLIEARERLLAADNDPGEARYLACSERQISNLLSTTEVTSADYNSIKALVRGEVNSFMGFQFVTSERLLKTAGPPDIRHCFAWVKSGLHFCSWKPLEFKADPRPDKNYVWQLWQACTIGAARTQEKKIVQINCAEG